MIGHDCKNCPSNGNCDIQNTDTKAKEILGLGGVDALCKWVIAAFLISPEDTYHRAMAALTLLADREGGPATLRKHMWDGACALPDHIPVRRNFKALMLVLSQGYSRGVITAATDTANKVSQALGIPLAVSIISTKDLNEAVAEHKEDKGGPPCTLH